MTTTIERDRPVGDRRPWRSLRPGPIRRLAGVAGAAGLSGLAGLAGAVDLAVPATCPGCGLPGEPWCRACRGSACGPPRRLPEDWLPAAIPPVTAAGWYTGPLASAVLAWKERDRVDLASWLAGLLAGALEEALGGVPAEAATGPPLLVPVPSSRPALRRRGRDVVPDLARRAGRALGPRQPAVVTLPALVRLDTREQKRRGAVDRREAAARFGVRPAAVRVLAAASEGRRPLLLVDDVVTTGTTALSAVSTLRAVGAAVHGVAVVCATPPVGPLCRNPSQV